MKYKLLSFAMIVHWFIGKSVIKIVTEDEDYNRRQREKYF